MKHRNITLFLDDKILVSSSNNLIQVNHTKINDVWIIKMHLIDSYDI